MTRPAATAARDVVRLEELPPEDGLDFELYVPDDDENADRRLKVFRTGQSVSLARALPIFTQMGIEVLDERPYQIELAGGSDMWIYDFGLRLQADRGDPGNATMPHANDADADAFHSFHLSRAATAVCGPAPPAALPAIIATRVCLCIELEGFR